MGVDFSGPTTNEPLVITFQQNTPDFLVEFKKNLIVSGAKIEY